MKSNKPKPEQLKEALSKILSTDEGVLIFKHIAELTYFDTQAVRTDGDGICLHKTLMVASKKDVFQSLLKLVDVSKKDLIFELIGE